MQRLALAAALAALCCTHAHAQPTPDPAPPTDDADDTPDLDLPPIERFDLRGVRLNDALRLLSELSGANFVATPEAGDTEVNLLLRDVPVMDAVAAICRANGLWYRQEGTVIQVMTTEEFRRDLTVIREPVTRVFDLRHPNPTQVAYAIRDLYGARVRFTPAIDPSQYDVPAGRQLTQNGTGGANNNQNNNPNSTSITIGQGITSVNNGGISPGSNGNNANDSIEDLAEDLTASQIARIQQENGIITGEYEDLIQGLPTIFITEIRRHNVLVVRTADEHALEEIEALVLDLDRPTPQVLLEVKILEVTLGDDFQSVFDISYNEGPNTTNLPDGQPANPLLGTATTVTEQIGAAGNGPLIGGALVYQFIDENIRARVQLLARENRAAVISSPLLMCANGELAQIFVGEERPLVRSFSQQTLNNLSTPVTVITPTVEIEEIGQTLTIVPRINADRTVTLSLLQENSTLNLGSATLPVPDQSGGISAFPIDTVSTSNLQATVIAQDGRTLVVGGLIQKQLTDRQEGIPYLMEIPIIGWIFGETVRAEVRRELVLLITPYVLLTPAEGEAQSRARLEALSLHPYQDLGDRALERYDRSDVPGAADYHLLIEDYLRPVPESP